MTPRYCLALSGVTAAILAGCAQEAEAPAPVESATPVSSASAELLNASGEMVGTATITDPDGILVLSISVNGIPAGMHGAHIHETGECTPPGFESAGGHWNPDNMNHGTESEPPNPHAGDLPNIVIDANGEGSLETTAGSTFARLMDADGAALVIHADPDDYTSQPAGNAGARIVCGVFQAA